MATGKVLGLTGSFGYIGRRLLERLKRSEDFERVLCTDIIEPKEKLPERFEYHHCDILDGEKLHRIFKEGKVDTVLHLAFIANPIRNREFEHEVDIAGTRNVLNACESLGVRKLVVTSSDCAYGFFPDTPDYLTEDAPLRATPGFPYAENKVEMEKIVAEFAERVKSCSVVVIRPCTVFGPNVKNQTSDAMKQPFILGFTGCDPIMQFIHEEDAVEGFYLALVKDVRGAFNLAADEGLRYREMAKVIEKPFLALPVWLIYPLVEALYRLHLLPFGKAELSYIRYPLSMSIERIQKELGFRPKYSTAEALRAFMDNLK